MRTHYTTVDGQVGPDGYVTTHMDFSTRGALVTPVSPAQDTDYNPWTVLGGSVAVWDADPPARLRVKFFGTDASTTKPGPVVELPVGTNVSFHVVCWGATT